MNSIYTRLALEVVEQLGDHRMDVEDALAEGRDGALMATLRVFSPRYKELVSWALDLEGRKQLDSCIKVELKRIGWW